MAKLMRAFYKHEEEGLRDGDWKKGEIGIGCFPGYKGWFRFQVVDAGGKSLKMAETKRSKLNSPIHIYF